MSIFDNWARYIARILQEESQLAGNMVTHMGELGSARESIVKGVLERVLPSMYDIGTGEIIDHTGAHSRQIDIVISRRDFPTLRLPSGSRLYLVESVLATVEVKSTLDRATLTEALENCASVGDLKPNVVAGVLDHLAAQRGLVKVSSGSYRHDNPLETARFDLLGRPVSYIFGFKGYRNDVTQLAKTIAEWMKGRESTGKASAMRHHPAVIATEGCFTWRNAPPYIVDHNIVTRVGQDDNPLRIFVLNLLFTLKSRLLHLPDQNALTPNLDAYLQQMEPFTTTMGVGQARNLDLTLANAG